MKTDEADKYFSLCVRERSGWRCEICGRVYVPPTRALHCSHYFSRKYYSVRTDPDNAEAHCYACHLKVEGDPDFWHDRMAQKLGSGLDDLRRRAYDVGKAKFNRHNRAAIAKHYREEYNRMFTLRVAGFRGRIDITPYKECPESGPSNPRG